MNLINPEYNVVPLPDIFTLAEDLFYYGFWLGVPIVTVLLWVGYFYSHKKYKSLTQSSENNSS